MSKNKKRVNVIYSTNPNYNYENENKTADTLENSEQNLKVITDNKQRKGKIVTLVTGFIGNEDDLKELAKLLKSKCGVGGSIKNSEILIQGDLKEKIYQILLTIGFSKIKKVGK